MSTVNPEPDGIELPGRAVPGGAIREAAVSSTYASKNPCRCPVCGGGDVLIEGQFRREFAEEFVAGETTGYTTGEEVEKNVLAVLCATCKVRYVIEPDQMFDLRKQIVEMAIELGRMRGMNAIEPASERLQ